VLWHIEIWNSLFLELPTVFEIVNRRGQEGGVYMSIDAERFGSTPVELIAIPTEVTFVRPANISV
jgi:hypothetical protein